MFLRSQIDNRFDTTPAYRVAAFGLVVAAVAAAFYLLSASAAVNSTPLSSGVARADVIDEYEEPPPPTPQPEPQPSPGGGGGGGGGKPSSGGSGSDSGTSYSYSSDSSTTGSSADASAGKKKDKADKPERVAPEAERRASVALHEPSNDSFFAAAFGGAGWLLPVLMIAFAIGAAVYMRFGNSGQSRIESPNPRTSRSRSRS